MSTCRAAGVETTAFNVLSAGALTKLVREGLVRHQAAVQAMAPPLLPSVCLTSGGFVARIGMAASASDGAGASDKAAENAPPPGAAADADLAGDAQRPGSSRRAHAKPLSAADYEFVMSAINLRATLLSRFDVARRLSTAAVAYDAAMRVDMEGGFKRAQLSALLRDPDVSDVVRDVHESAVVAWLHPGDGDALLATWRAMAAAGGAARDGGSGGGGTGRRSAQWSAEDAKCAIHTVHCWSTSALVHLGCHVLS